MTDPNISLQYKGVQVPDFANAFFQGQQARLQQQQAANAQETHAQQMQEGALNIQQTQNALNATAAQNAAWKASITTDPATGAPTVDRNARDTSLINAGQGSLLPGIHKQDAEFDKAQADAADANAKLAAAHTDYAGHVGDVVAKSGYDPGVFIAQANDAIASKAVDARDAGLAIQHVQQLQQADPSGAQAQAFVKQISDQWMQKSPAIQKQITEKATADAAASKATTDAAAEKLAQDKFNAEKGGIDADTQLKQAKVKAWQMLTTGDPQALAHYVAGSVDPQKYPDLYASTLNLAQHAGGPDEIAAVVSKGAQTISDQNRQIAVESDPKVLQGREQVQAAGATASAQAQSKESAIKTMLTSQSSVAQLQSTGDMLKGLLQKAKNGDASAAQSFKTMYPLFQIATQGSHRLVGDMTEETPGGAMDKLGAIASNISTGVRMTDAQFKQAGGVIDQIVGGTARAHNAAADAYNSQYKTSFAHVADPTAIPIVNSQADYDKLPRGAVFMEDGKKLVKQ
jgi:hypothetical protein